MDSCCNQRDRAHHRRRPWPGHRTSHRLGVVLGLFALLVMLASPVLHTVESARETVRPSGTSGTTLRGGSAALPLTFCTVPASAQAPGHDALLCPVCQILSQTRHSLTSASVGIAPPHHSITAVSHATFQHARPDLAAAAPRAPPFLT